MLYRLAKNFFFLLTASIVDKLVYALFFAIIARKLSQADFGAYNLYLTLLFFGGMITDFGISYVVIREVSKNNERSCVYFNNALIINIFLSAVAWPSMVGISFWLNYPAEVVFLMSFGGTMFVFMGAGQTAAAIVKAHERMDIYALIGSCHSIVSLSIGLLVVWFGGNLSMLVMVLIITEGIKSVILILVVHKCLMPIRLKVDKAILVKIIKQALPFTLLMAYGVFIRRMDILFLGWLKPIEEVAVYSVAAKFADFLSLVSASMAGAIYPALSARAESSRQNLWYLYTESMAIFTIFGFGIAISTILLAKPVIMFLFGELYIHGDIALSWLGFAFLFNMLSGPAGNLLLATGDKMVRLLIMCAVVLGGSVILNLWLIPLFSYNGAAVATCLGTILGFIGRLILSHKYFGRLPNLGLIMWRPLTASLLMGILLYSLKGQSLFILILLGVLFYFVALVALGEFRMARYKPIKSKLYKIFGVVN